MRAPSYDDIEPLIADSKIDGSTIEVSFRCPVTQTEVPSQGTMRAGRDVSSVAQRSVKRSLSQSLRRAVFSAIRGALGSGLLGRAGQDVARSVLTDATDKMNHTHSSGEKQAALLEAFEQVQSQFVWDAKSSRWVAAEALGAKSEFSSQLASAPVRAKYDRGVLARMLVEIAAADGSVSAEEKDFLAGFVTPDLGSIDQLLAAGSLSSVDLSEVSAGSVRETLLMLAWAAACTDEDLDASEQAKLTDFAAGLGLSSQQATKMRTVAQEHVLNAAFQAAYSDGVDATKKAQVLAVAAAIGVPAEQAQRFEIRFRKAHGLV